MIKFRLYWDKDEETKWLNEMALQLDSLSDMTKRGIMMVGIVLIAIGVYKTFKDLAEK